MIKEEKEETSPMNTIPADAYALEKYAVKNGELIPERDAEVPVTVREVFFNFSVYESVKVIRGTAVFLEDHIERLLDSAQRLGIKHSFTEAIFTESMELLTSADSINRGTVRVQLIGGREPMFFMFHTPLPQYPAACYSRGVKLISYPGERIIPEVKSNCLLLNYVALREAEDKGAMEALLVNRYGKAVEGTRSNVFAIDGNRLVTAGSGVLSGVSRRHILEAAESRGMTIVYDDISLEDLKDGMYDEVFITSTSMGAIPAAEIDDVPVGSEFPGTQHVHAVLRRLEAEYVRKKQS